MSLELELLRQVIEEIANLRNENTRLRLKQIIKRNSTTNDASQSSVSPALSATPQMPIPSPINGQSDKDDSTNSMNLEQAQSDTPEKFVSSKINSSNTPRHIENTSDSTSDPDIPTRDQIVGRYGKG